MKRIFSILILALSTYCVQAQALPSGCIAGNLKLTRPDNFMLCTGHPVYWIYDNTGRKAVRAKILSLLSVVEGTVLFARRTFEIIPVLDVAMTRGCLRAHSKSREQVCVGDRVKPIKQFSRMPIQTVVGLFEDGGLVVQDPRMEDNPGLDGDLGVVINSDEYEFAN